MGGKNVFERICAKVTPTTPHFDKLTRCVMSSEMVCSSDYYAKDTSITSSQGAFHDKRYHQLQESSC